MQVSERKTNQEILNKTACSSCFHNKDEHDSGKNKCYALDFDGSSYSACRCQNFRSEYKISVKVPK